jgi:hypothetical protein
LIPKPALPDLAEDSGERRHPPPRKPRQPRWGGYLELFEQVYDWITNTMTEFVEELKEKNQSVLPK